MKKIFTTRRITKDALLLAVMCILGMIALPLGANIKVSMQLLVVFIICLISDSVFDGLIITSLYLVLGLFVPVYAGFSMGITPTFGFVISFVFVSPVIYFINKLPIKNNSLRMSLACLGGLVICYLIGSIYMMFYLHLSFVNTLLISVVPYLAFDFAKIICAVLIILLLPKSITHIKDNNFTNNINHNNDIISKI